ncbi:hypothetical protein DL98DRAFT_505506, partial [Cadophora sp. DSE1049]
MKHTLGYCQRVFERHIIAAYFFNAQGDSFEKTSLGMLRSLLYQLLEREPSIFERFIPIFHEKRRKHGAGEWEWRESELKEFILSEIQRHQTSPLLLLVDALDECNESDVRNVVKFLEELSIKAIGAKTTLNICLSSRHYPHISIEKRQELVVEKRREHDDDITKYVRAELTKLDEEIQERVLEKASGIFLWVVLAIAILNKAYDDGKVEAMRQKLHEVPSDLEEVFETLLSKDNPNKHETILMLQCVLFMRRALKPEELYFAMMAGLHSESLGAWDPSKVTPDDIRRRITSSSRGLIEVRKGQAETVQFIHESVRDFLLQPQRLQKLDPALELNPIGTCHDRLRSCCMSYIMMEALPLPKDWRQAESLGSSYPFLKYASTYILDHTEEAEARNLGQAGFLQRLRDEDETFERLRLFHNFFETPKCGCVRGANLLHISSFHGHNELIKILLKKRADVNAQGGLFGTALQAAASQSKEEIVAILLEKGAKVNAQGGLFGTALQAATFQGKREIVAMLLEKGANVNALGGSWGTALQAAAGTGR